MYFSNYTILGRYILYKSNDKIACLGAYLCLSVCLSVFIAMKKYVFVWQRATVESLMRPIILHYSNIYFNESRGITNINNIDGSSSKNVCTDLLVYNVSDSFLNAYIICEEK